MSWRDADCICEGVGHIVDAFKDKLPCKGHVWNEYGAKPVYYVSSLGKDNCGWEVKQSEILCKFNGKDEKNNEIIR